MTSISRITSAFIVASAIILSSIAGFAQTTQTGPSSTDKTANTTQSPDQTGTATTAKNDTKTGAKNETKALPPLPAKSKQPLSVNDDPTMIGKRNINKGIIAKMSGSTEKEVRMGRELAAEVDRQAKFIDDPAITEYVNRVGQNIVLHSDARIPFTIKVIDSDEVNAFALPGGFFYVN